jgi:chromosomal replication initiator protein
LELPTHLELDPAWLAIRAELRRVVGQSTYEIWLAPLRVQSWDGAVLTLEAPPATQAWTSRRYGRILERCARDVVGTDVTVSFAEAAGEISRKPAHSSSLAAATNRDQPINPRLNFNQFIIGEGNRLAHAAALSVAELPGQAYNPLFLYAPPGLGKTHLLHAIGNYVLAYGGGTTVRYTTVEAFTNHFISALTSHTLDHFKHLYRDADVLLVDDVQFLASKAKTEEEFFHTFNALYETGRQLVLTCDRLPRQLPRVEERLRERFESGLVAELGAPDFATRVAILRKRVTLDQIELDDPTVLELIAERVTDNIRALEGALIRVVAHHSLRGQPINLELATSVLDEIHPLRTPAGITVTQIQQVVAAYFEITTDELVSPNRSARIAWPRQLAIHFARELTSTSLQRLGDAFGGRNHATMLHACKKVDERLESSPEAVHNLKQLHALLMEDGADLTS